MPDRLQCFRCRKTPDELEEYAEICLSEENQDLRPEDYVRKYEGTYNREEQTFCCTDCYFLIGAPSAPPPGWKAPGLPLK